MKIAGQMVGMVGALMAAAGIGSIEGALILGVVGLLLRVMALERGHE